MDHFGCNFILDRTTSSSAQVDVAGETNGWKKSRVDRTGSSEFVRDVGRFDVLDQTFDRPDKSRSEHAYLTTLAGRTPKINAIAVTDYYVTDTHEEFLTHKAAGRLPHVSLLFANIELRLDVAAKSGFVNVH